MKSKLIKKLGCVLLCMLMVLSLLPAQAIAADFIALEQDVALTITCQEASVPLVGAAFSIYRVADVNPADWLDFTLTDEFASSRVRLQHADSSGWREAANQLAGFAQMHQLTALDSGKTDEAGSLVFPTTEAVSMRPGLYLVIGQNHTQDGHIYTPEAFLVSLPQRSETDGSWQYSCAASPKYTVKPVDPTATVDRKVIKVWEDEGYSHHRPEEISAVLLRDGEIYDTVILNQENNWSHRWEGLDANSLWSVAEQDAPEGYAVSIRQDGITFVITNTYEPANETVNKRVMKVWDDDPFGHQRPAFIQVELLCGGEVYDTVTLNAANRWAHTWENLDATCDWSVREKEVPAGYRTDVIERGDSFVIINRHLSEEETVSKQVVKLWDDASYEENRPGQITVELLENGAVYDTVTLDAQNDWKHRWDGLNGASQWSIRETAVPENYTAEVQEDGNVFILTNTYKNDQPTADPVERSVLKLWRDEGHLSARPSEIQAALLCDGQVYDVVTLNEANGWTHRWTNLDGTKDWTVTEYTQLDAYTYYISRDGDMFIITNIYSEIPRTGQLWWPVPMLFAAGLGMIVIGLVRRRGMNHEA